MLPRMLGQRCSHCLLRQCLCKLIQRSMRGARKRSRDICNSQSTNSKASVAERWSHVGGCSQEKGFCATGGVGEDTRIKAQSLTAGTGGVGRSESKTCCCSRGMCKRGTRNRRRGRPRRGDARRGPEQHKGSLPRLVQLVRLYFTVKRVEERCTSTQNSPTCCWGSWYEL